MYEYECAADASPGACLLTAGCGWCYAAPAVEGSGENIGACMPCTPSAIAGRPADCAAGAAYPQRCDARSWTFSAPLELPPAGTCADAADAEAHCGAWAGAGECARNAAFMRLKCRRSCGMCTV